ncbi:hypothetical protein HRbin32_00991 [bacterium HR32]|nr:hypothetical protein HRbin32_00991 [bacterium HR32]
MLKVLADHREARSEVPRRLREMGVEVVETALPVGDYVLSPRVGVERKTASDFVAALVRKRFCKEISEAIKSDDVSSILEQLNSREISNKLIL